MIAGVRELPAVALQVLHVLYIDTCSIICMDMSLLIDLIYLSLYNHWRRIPGYGITI